MEWFQKLGNAVKHGRENAHVAPAAERDLYGGVAYVGDGLSSSGNEFIPAA